MNSKSALRARCGRLGATTKRILRESGNDDEKPWKFADVGLKRETRVDSDMTSVDSDYPAAIDHRPSRCWKSLAASRWSPLDLQKFHSVKVGI
jgi:hypothetical protein